MGPVHWKKNWSENKSLFWIPISPTVFSISVVQNLCTSPLSLFQITQVGKKTLTLLMETNSIPWSKKYFRCICLNSVGNALSVGRIFSISSPPRFLLYSTDRLQSYVTQLVNKFNFLALYSISQENSLYLLLHLASIKED